MMGILSALASIPTASNLALKLKDAEADVKRLKEKNFDLEAENAKLACTVSDLNAQVVVLTSRLTALEEASRSSQALPRAVVNAGVPKARDW